MTTVTFKKGGTGEHSKDINHVVILDLWHVGQNLIEQGDVPAGEAVLEVWGIAHDLKRHIQEA